MSTVTESGQSYLEIEGMEARKEQMGRSDYNPGKEYNEQQATIANGGKGSGYPGGHGWVIPDMTKDKSQISGSGMFNTDEGGNSCDQKLREVMMSRQLYKPGYVYCPQLTKEGNDGGVVIDTKANVLDGQYDGSITKLAWTCPTLT